MKTINIKKIVVPVDFSTTSINAIHIAAAIAARHEAEIHLFYADDCDYTLFADDENLKPQSETEYKKSLAKLAKNVTTANGIQCSYSSETGAITYTILKKAKELSADLIVMGKNGNNGSSTEYAGTYAIQIAEKSRIPVIIVPVSATKYSFENILFPVRPLLSVPDKYEAIRPFILKSHPSISLINLRNPDYENELHIIHKLSLLMKEKLEKDNIKYSISHYFKNAKFAEHVLELIDKAEEKFDLAVITAEIDKSNKDFHIGYYVRKIIHQSPIPVLVLRPGSAKLNKDEVLIKLEKIVEPI